MNLFLDTSAPVKLYHHEEGTESLWNFLIRYSSDLFLTISDLTPLELRSAFLKQVRMGEIEADTAKQVFEGFDKDMQFINIVEIDKSIKDRAVELLDEHASTKNLRTLDSLQLSAAIGSNENFAIDYFITADQRLLDVAQLYFSIYNPVEIKAGSTK